MTGGRAHLLYERALARALTAADPVAALRRSARDVRLPARLRAAFARADADGVRVAALLVARLRFERLLHGSEEAARAYEQDPESFTEEFRRYHHAAPPTSFFPVGEARQFAEWRRAGRRVAGKRAGGE